jgi:hypothetical protein
MSIYFMYWRERKIPRLVVNSPGTYLKRKFIKETAHKKERNWKSLRKFSFLYVFEASRSKRQVDIRKIFISILASLQGIRKASVSLRKRKINELRFFPLASWRRILSASHWRKENVFQKHSSRKCRHIWINSQMANKKT